MLQTLSIQNVALITKLTIDFEKGLNILLGETGAGKSIIFDSINFVLGEKLDKTLLRSGESSMRVDAMFTQLNQTALDKLKEYDFDGEELLLTRIYSLDGKSSCKVNGIPCTTSILKEIGSILVDSYSQQESVELLKTKNHLIMLDKYGGSKISSLKEELKEEFNNYQEINKQINNLGGSEFERERTKSLLEFQIKEIEDAQLIIGEDVEAYERLKILNNAEKIHEAITLCEDYLNDSSTSIINNLQQSTHILSSLNIERIEDCKNRLDSTRYEIEDIYQTLVDIKNESEFDEKEFNSLDRRLDLIKSLTKKYGGSIEKTLDYLEEIKIKLSNLNDSEFLLEKLNKEKEKVYTNLLNICDKLTKLRKENALIIEEKIINEIRQLGMKSSKFEVKFNILPEITSNGLDEVEFVFSANKGQEVKSLSKTASGGELSRFMLAIKNIFAEIGSSQTLIFDEIDSGISGETGNIVGQKLNNITSFAQILCITHLPQVACYGDNFFFVSKVENEFNTETHIKQLTDQEICHNIARMIVGDDVSETSLSQAKEMRKKAGKSV